MWCQCSGRLLELCVEKYPGLDGAVREHLIGQTLSPETLSVLEERRGAVSCLFSVEWTPLPLHSCPYEELK